MSLIICVVAILVGVPLVYFNLPKFFLRPLWMGKRNRFTKGGMFTVTCIVLAIATWLLMVDLELYRDSSMGFARCNSRIDGLKGEIYELLGAREIDLTASSEKFDELRLEISERDKHVGKINSSRELWGFNPVIWYYDCHLKGVEVNGKQQLGSILREFQTYLKGRGIVGKSPAELEIILEATFNE